MGKRWQDASESLVFALQQVLQSAGDDPPADELLAATGAAFATVVTMSDEPAQWLQAGRDLWLRPAAAVYGIQIRELHPPEAAAGVMAVPEFQQHFTDSYRPLIARALQHGQVVLARGGWPAPAQGLWGVIVANEPSVGFQGRVAGFAGTVPHLEAASQCYVLEHVRPIRPDVGTLARSAREGARRYAAPPYPSDLLAGTAAWIWWQERVASAVAGTLADFAAFARELSALRRGAERFARSVADRLGASSWEAVRAAAAQVQARLDAVLDLLQRPLSDRSALFDAIGRAAAADARLQEAVGAAEVPQSTTQEKV